MQEDLETLPLPVVIINQYVFAISVDTHLAVSNIIFYPNKYPMDSRKVLVELECLEIPSKYVIEIVDALKDHSDANELMERYWIHAQNLLKV